MSARASECVHKVYVNRVMKFRGKKEGAHIARSVVENCDASSARFGYAARGRSHVLVTPFSSQGEKRGEGGGSEKVAKNVDGGEASVDRRENRRRGSADALDEREKQKKKKKGWRRENFIRTSRGRTKLTGDGIDDAGRRRLHSHREVDSRGGRGRGKDIQRCYVSFTYVMIGTYTHAHTPVHTRTRKVGGR